MDFERRAIIAQAVGQISFAVLTRWSDILGPYQKAEARSFRKPDTLATAIWKTDHWQSDTLNYRNRHPGQRRINVLAVYFRHRHHKA